MLDWLDRAPQTNEAARSAALIAGARFLGGLIGPERHLSLLELGCSAGLNLNFSIYALEYKGNISGISKAGVILSPEWRGSAPPTEALLPVVRARGVDLSPPDAVADRLRLLAYVWPDQSDRIARLEKALALAAIHRPEVARGDAADWLEQRLSEAPLPAGEAVLVYHTIA